MRKRRVQRRIKFWVRKALTLSAMVPFSGWGQSLTPSLSRPHPRIEQNERGTTQNVSGQMRLESMQYFTTVDDSPDLNQFQFLSGRFALSDRFKVAPSFGYRADFAAGTYFRPNQDDFAVNELALEYQFGENSSASLGRKKALWSLMDDSWNLGLWQPRLAIDTLRPESQGLSGLFVQSRLGVVKWMVFLTPIFVPTMGPDIKEENGSLVPDNRWYRQPSSTQIFNQKLNQVTYDIDIPHLSQLVVNPGYGSQVEIGDRYSGGWGLVSIGYKPVNDLLLKRQIVRYTNEPIFDVKVSPDVTYHQIFSADIGYSFSTFKISASFLEDRPEETRPEPDWSIQKLSPLRAASVQGQWELDSVFHRPFRVQFGYLQITNANIVDIDTNGKKDDFTLFSDRMRFTNTSYFGLEAEMIRIQSKPLEAKLKYLFDQDQKGGIVRTELFFYPKTDLALLMGADVIGVQDEDHREDSFLNQYRANDRFYGGMVYGF